MKKNLLFGIIILLLSACQPATPSPEVLLTPTTTRPTSTQPPLPTQTLTATPVFTTTPLPMYFMDEFNVPNDHWVSFQTGGETAPVLAVGNNQLTVDFNSPHTWVSAIYTAHVYSNIHVATSFQADTSGSVGVICYYDEEIGWFEFAVSSDRTYSVLFGQWIAEDVARYTPIANDTTEYLRSEAFSYEIELGCDEGFLFLYINNKLFRKIDASRFGLTEGKIGLTAASFEDVPSQTRLFWFRAEEHVYIP